MQVRRTENQNKNSVWTLMMTGLNKTEKNNEKIQEEDG